LFQRRRNAYFCGRGSLSEDEQSSDAAEDSVSGANPLPKASPVDNAVRPHFQHTHVRKRIDSICYSYQLIQPMSANKRMRLSQLHQPFVESYIANSRNQTPFHENGFGFESRFGARMEIP